MSDFIKAPSQEMKLLVSKKYKKRSVYSCKKSYFTSPKRAQDKLDKIATQKALNGAKPCRYYKCTKCNSYHLTSMSDSLYYEILETKARAKLRRLYWVANYWEQKLHVA